MDLLPQFAAQCLLLVYGQLSLLYINQVDNRSMPGMQTEILVEYIFISHVNSLV